MSQPKAENIKVVVRCRPLSKKEIDRGNFEIIRMDPSKNTVYLIKKPDDQEPKSFLFNSVYPNSADQQFIYDDCARPIIDSVLEGYNGTIFAYGQTGTGKTYTMEGDISSEQNKGIILHAFDHIFARISGVKNIQFLVRASYLQIYMEDVCDLLGDPSKKLHVRQLDTGVTVVGLSSHIVKNPKEITDLLLNGAKNRTTGATAMNQQSSRSHSVFTIIIEQQEEDGRTKMGKLNLVDLAGSERLGKTEATGQRAKEGAKINQSLLALGNVISALVTGSKHVAYRDSKLTQLLQDSLGGNAKTVMVATLGPANYNYDETLSTLLYATRARDIKNIPKINEDPKDALLGQLKAQIDALKKQLEEQNAETNGNGVAVGDNQYLKQIEHEHKKKLKELMAEKSMNEEQRQQMKAKLDAEYEASKKTKEESEQLKAKIAQMEQSVLVGGVNLVDKAKQQQEEIRAHESKMRRQQEEQKALSLKRKQQEEEILLAEKKYGSIKDELVEKVHKIKKIRPLIKKMEESIDDIQQQFEREREEQSNQIKSLSRELLLLQMIASSFIPEQHIANIEKHCKYDEVNQKMYIDKVELAGCHQKVEEEVFEDNSVYIQGIDGAIFGGAKPIVEDEELKQKKAAAQKKRKMAAHRLLNQFALADTMDSKND
ncbi:Kinesin-like protein kif3a [Tritrichomonas musculus]|uniref:Kinesin-like protein n=1 Tax=Tritrichomonas musculus TaxID=1915356 RepID=A0ABR2K0Y1_9EUKA